MPHQALARCVGDVDRFLAERLGQAPHLAAGAGPYDDLLSLADVDHALTSTGLRHPAVRVVRAGEPVPVAAYTRSARSGSATVTALVDAGRLLDRFASGDTIVLQSLQRWWPRLTDLCGDLELALGHRVQANAYLTPPGAAGLADHHDTHDVFVLQVAGTKRWVLREPLVDAPLARHRSAPEAASQQAVHREVDLHPGDALYLPRGWVHAAASQDGVSLHLTVGVLATTVHDVLRALVDRAADDPRFRRSLPLGTPFHPDLGAQAVKDAVAELTTWLEQVDPTEVAASMASSFVSGRRPALSGQLLELAHLDDLDDRTVVTRRPGVLLHRAVEGDRLTVIPGDRTITRPAAVAPAVDLLLDGATRPVADVTGLLDESSRAVLARRLVREGLLVTATGPEHRRG